MASPALAVKLGVFVSRPFTVMCPWVTSWRACERDFANPERYTVLSRRVSRLMRSVSPVAPVTSAARSNVFFIWRSSTPYMRRAFCFSRSWSAKSLTLRLRGDLRRVGRALARALPAGGAGRGPRDHVSRGVGERHDRVVERRFHVRRAAWHDALLAAATRLRLGRGTCLRVGLLRLVRALLGTLLLFLLSLLRH